IEVDKVELELLQTCLASKSDALRTMICVPELGDDEHFLPLDLPLLEHLLHCFTDLCFGLVTFRSVKQAKSRFQRRSRRVFGGHTVGNQGAKSECGHRGTIVERYLRIAKVVDFQHRCPPSEIYQRNFSLQRLQTSSDPDHNREMER